LSKRGVLCQKAEFNLISNGQKENKLKNIGIPTLLEIPSIEETIDLCQSLGLSIIEANMTRPEFLPKSLSSQRLLDLSSTHGIEFTLHLPEEMDLGTFHDTIRNAWINYLIETIQWANSSGIKLATMHLSNGIYYTMPDGKKWLYAHYEAEYLERMKGAMDTVFSRKPDDFQLCVENCGNFHLPFIKSLLQEIDVGLTWDVGHDAESGFSDWPYLESKAEQIQHVHLHDAINGKSHRELFTGEVRIDVAIEFIISRGIKAIIEVKTVDALCRSIEKLRERHAQHLL
jgi:sugar phosphate isomerase/epimerase